MARDLPYFQFEPAEYLTRDVSFCSLGAQGLFINICAYYWQRECNLSKEQILRRFNYPSEFEELVSEGVVDLKDGLINIKFLDIQYKEVSSKKIDSSEKGKIGNLKRWHKDIYLRFIGKEISLKEALAMAKSSGGDKLAIAKTSQRREEERIEEKRREDEKKVDVNKIKNIDVNFSVADASKAENSYVSIKVLIEEYKNNDQVVNAVLKNVKNGFKSKEHLFKRLEDFNSRLTETGVSMKTWVDYCSHFRDWHMKSKKATDSINTGNRRISL